MATVAATFTAYTSPNEMFSTVKEVAIRIALAEQAPLGRSAHGAYVAAAFELEAERGVGQADGGAHAGRYLEAGAAPGFDVRRLGVAFPVRVGMSLGNYYELGGVDHRFGFLGVGGIVSVPLTTIPGGGGVLVRGGVEHHVLGETTRTFNGGDRSKTTATIGIRVAY